MKDLNKFLGTMFGGAIGDALGSVTEFLTPDKFGYIKDFEGRPKFQTKAGERTDDTSMCLCLAQSLIDCNGFDIEDQLDKYLDWFSTGYMSSTGRAFGIGQQTGRNLFEYKKYKEGKIKNKPREINLSGKNKDANGSIMRIAPIALYYLNNINQGIFFAGESVKTTHNTDICIDTAKYFVGLIIGALLGETKDNLLKFGYSPINNYWKINNMNKKLKKIAIGSYKNKTKSELGLKYGYVLDSLEVALWGFYTFDSFEKGLLEIINLGYDADTNGCIYGYLAGAYYGYDGIPDRWKNKIAKKDLIEKITKELYIK